MDKGGRWYFVEVLSRMLRKKGHQLESEDEGIGIGQLSGKKKV